MANIHSAYALNLIDKLTLEEKIALVSGHNFFHTNEVPRLNIPSIRMSDGPHGLRIQGDQEAGVMASDIATCFPTASATANSWNPKLLEEMGKAMGEEARYYGIDIILGPGVNIKRNPLCGRNFEYFSEDPLLAGVLGTAEVKGIQSEGIGTSLKHFAFNNEENHRMMGNSIVDMRAARELYLKQFEYIVKNSKPETIMNAYNSFNGVNCSENKWLLTDLLRKDWGFDGLVMTDWGATAKRVEGIKAGNDLEMPGDTLICRKWLFDAVKSGELDEKELDERVLNVLDLVSKHLNKNKLNDINWQSHHTLAGSIAEESAVLLRNKGVLPLSKEEKICVLGELFEKMRYQGAGSSMINPSLLTSCKEAFDKYGINYTYLKGYEIYKNNSSKQLLKETIEQSKSFDKVLVFAGLTDNEETEGGDREAMSLPANQLNLIDELVRNNKKVIVVLFGGSVVELPFFEKVEGILNMFLPGQNGGEATYKLLFGESNPSGKLAETWPISYCDVPYSDEFGKTKKQIYKESVYVGYRYYLSVNKEVRFPFGYGLSYTNFEYKNLKVKELGNSIKALIEIKNVGSCFGKEVVQLYIEGPDTSFFKPKRELKAFSKVSLNAGESQTVELSLKKDDLRHWNIKENKWSFEKGKYLIQIGLNSRDIVLEKEIEFDGDNLDDVYEKSSGILYKNADFNKIDNHVFEEMSLLKIPEENKSKRYTIESRIDELKRNLIGKILYKVVIGVANKELKKAKRLPNGSEKDNQIKAAMSLKRMLESNCPLGMTMGAGNQFPYNYAEGLVDLANWKIFKGIKKFKTKIDAPNLPIEQK